MKFLIHFPVADRCFYMADFLPPDGVQQPLPEQQEGVMWGKTGEIYKNMRAVQ